jgi:hypothetical protein
MAHSLCHSSESEMFKTPCETCFTGKRDCFVLYRVCMLVNGPHFEHRVYPADCRRCKSAALIATPPRVDALPPPEPTFVTKIFHYAAAMREWLAAGRPTRSDSVVRHLYDTYCANCSWNTDTHDICIGCGCRVAERGPALVNKIKMATQHCPRDLW